ncbi:MAG: DinB family protein [Planctomycetota bacterium]
MSQSLASQLAPLFLRDLDTLRAELDAYAATDQLDALWSTPPGITNSAGNLILHLCGNLRTFVGHHLGQIDYTRDRDFEFAGRDVPVDEMRAIIDATKDAVARTLASITADQLAADFPLKPGGHTVNTQHFLLHLLGHLDYHLGQIDYHRRLVTGQNTAVGAQAIGVIAAPAAG